MLQLTNIALQRGSKALFDKLNLVVHPGQHLGLVGRNGAGKSTLFELILGQTQADAGEVKLPRGWRIAHLAQDAPASSRSALDFVLDGHSELRAVQAKIDQAEKAGDDLKLAHLLQALEDLDGYRAESTAAKILNGLGFANAELDTPVEQFSGGWRVRLALAQTLMTPADLMLLDEPTNHLDMEATLWLERWLANFSGTLITIAHDRDFLDRATRHTAHLENGQAQLYTGNYSAFEHQYAERANLAAAQSKKAAARAREIQAFVDRFRAKASKARQVQSRIKALEKLGDTAIIAAQADYEFEFSAADKVSKPLINLSNATLGYISATDVDASSKVLSGVSLQLQPGARVGVLGLNGAGKSTLLKTIAGDLDLIEGELVRGKHSKVGYFAQHQMERLVDANSALATLQLEHPERLGSEAQARNYLGGWGFRGDDVYRGVASFSGGERARLVLALIAAAQPALLILDEPTNHLDLDMRRALAFALQSYPGAVLLVSHDRHLLRQCVDELWLVADGKVEEFAADLGDYERGNFGPTNTPEVKQVAAKTSAPKRQNPTGEPVPATPAIPVASDRRQSRAAGRAATRPLRREIERLEVEMAALTEESKTLQTQLADNATYARGNAVVSELLIEQGQVNARLAAVEQAWLARVETLEQVESAD